jgi:hypothetical protein
VAADLRNGFELARFVNREEFGQVRWLGIEAGVVERVSSGELTDGGFGCSESLFHPPFAFGIEPEVSIVFHNVFPLKILLGL